MSGSRRLFVILSCATSLAATLAAVPAAAQSSGNCYAQITTPYQGAGVGQTGRVEGVSDAKGDVAVWVLTHRKGINDWWPQAGGPVSNSGAWSADVTFGTAAESGQPFEIAVIPVDTRTNEGLAGWIARAAQYNEFPGIPLPRAARGCRYNIVEVRRG